jgi:histidine triad (HIT) family protein
MAQSFKLPINSLTALDGLMTDCLFCRIISGEIPANIIHQDEHILAFDDINPQAPIHKIIIPKLHIATLNDLTTDNAVIVGKIILAAKDIAKNLNISDQGFRVVMNCLSYGGQTVYHIHTHLLGGRQMIWPPG